MARKLIQRYMPDAKSIKESRHLRFFLGSALHDNSRIFIPLNLGIGSMFGMIATTTLFNLIGSDTNMMFSMPWYWHMVWQILL